MNTHQAGFFRKRSWLMCLCMPGCIFLTDKGVVKDALFLHHFPFFFLLFSLFLLSTEIFSCCCENVRAHEWSEHIWMEDGCWFLKSKSQHSWGGHRVCAVLFPGQGGAWRALCTFAGEFVARQLCVAGGWGGKAWVREFWILFTIFCQSIQCWASPKLETAHPLWMTVAQPHSRWRTFWRHGWALVAFPHWAAPVPEPARTIWKQFGAAHSLRPGTQTCPLQFCVWERLIKRGLRDGSEYPVRRSPQAEGCVRWQGLVLRCGHGWPVPGQAQKQSLHFASAPICWTKILFQLVGSFAQNMSSSQPEHGVCTGLLTDKCLRSFKCFSV